jgi:hypothetical protein
MAERRLTMIDDQDMPVIDALAPDRLDDIAGGQGGCIDPDG